MSVPPAGSEEIETRTVRKLVRRLIPLMIVLYFLNFLDRVNMSYAALDMNAELGLTASMFGLAAGVFFIGYVLFEVPSNIAMLKFGARVWIARIAVTWGLCSAALAFAQGPGSLYALRALLGVAEAGLYPGLLLYVALWFPARRRAQMLSMFLLGIPLSSVLGAPLSTAIMQYGDGLFGMSGWRLLFLAEGIPSVIVGVWAFFWLTSRPQEARWLADDERAWLVGTLEAENQAPPHQKGALGRTVRNPRVLLLGVVLFGQAFGLWALTYFLPQMIKGLETAFGTRFSYLQVGLVTAIPFAVATVGFVWWARHSDRTGERRLHCAVPLLLGAVAVVACVLASNPYVLVAGIALGLTGMLSSTVAFWQLPARVVAGTGVAAAGAIALINCIGAASGYLGPHLFGLLKDWTGSFGAGLYVVAGFMILSAVTVLLVVPARRGAPETAEPSRAVVA
ncbi:MFS transporter [Sphaerisporangium sp. NPDC005289]|uniref:MFS transporter n=1 Tax=Sphaerisporangium sp. NPDC005289 TaxID=3155247 RepID=UPI0033A11D70